MSQLFFMTNLFMKFQICDLIFVTDAQTNGRTNGRTSPKQYAPLTFSKPGGKLIKNIMK